MEPARPVQNNVSLPGYDQICRVDASTCCQSAEIEESFKAGTVEGLVDFEDWAQLDIFPNFDSFSLFTRE